MTSRRRKPDSRTAMYGLIRQLREAIPLGLSEDDICGDSCEGCSSKLLIYLETELDSWESRLQEGVIPTLGDLDRLAKQGRKIQRVLQQNGIVDNPS